MKNLFILALLCLSFISYGQIQSLKINTWNVEYYIPPNSTASKLPAIIFFPGNGEVGTDKNKLYINSPMIYVRNGTLRPNYIIAACQFPSIFANQGVVQIFLDTLIAKYKVDRNCIVLTGLSGGAYSIFNYIQNQPTATFIKPSAIVPMSYNWTPNATDSRYVSIYQWLFCGWADSYYQNALTWHNYLNGKFSKSKFSAYKLPIVTSNQGASGHCCWSTYYDPNYRENGLNIYEWAMNSCKTSLALPTDTSRSVRVIKNKADVEDRGSFWKFNQSGTIIIYRIDGARLSTQKVSKGQTIEKQNSTDQILFIR